MLATLIVRVTLISRFVLHRETREINVSRKFHVIWWMAKKVVADEFRITERRIRLKARFIFTGNTSNTTSKMWLMNKMRTKLLNLCGTCLGRY